MFLQPALRCLFLIIAWMVPVSSALALEDAILAVVNDEVITVKDLKEYMKSIYAQLKIEGRSPSEISEVMAQYENKGIDQLIEDRLILSSADKMGVIIRPKAIDERFDEIKRRYPSYQDFLSAINKEGLTVTEIRKKIENQIKGQAMVNTEVRSKVYVNPQEVTDYYSAHANEFTNQARVYLETIFVKSVFDKESARKKIAEALAAIKGGMSFQAAVTQYSELPSVGVLAEDQLRPEFKERIDHMKLTEVSEVIEVPNGFYLIKLEGRTGMTSASLKDVKDHIYQNLFENKFKERFRIWTEGLRQKAYVEVKQ